MHAEEEQLGITLGPNTLWEARWPSDAWAALRRWAVWWWGTVRKYVFVKGWLQQPVAEQESHLINLDLLRGRHSILHTFCFSDSSTTDLIGDDDYGGGGSGGGDGGGGGDSGNHENSSRRALTQASLLQAQNSTLPTLWSHQGVSLSPLSS